MSCVELSATWTQATGATSRIPHLLFTFSRYLVIGYQQSSGPVIMLHVDTLLHWILLQATRYTIISYSCPTGTRIQQFTEYRHFIYCYHRYMDARYTVISRLHITIAYAYIVSIFLSDGSPFILHALLLHV